jgi:hypothetical protein
MYIMKKVIFAVVLLMGFMFVQTASASTLSWGANTPTGSNAAQGHFTSGLNNDSAINGWFLFTNSFSGAFSHTYTLTSNPADDVYAFAITLPTTDFHINYVKLDGVSMPLVSGQYTALSGIAGTHTIAIDGSVLAAHQGEQYTLSAVATPIPAALWLFGSGIAGLVSMSRRKNTIA